MTNHCPFLLLYVLPEMLQENISLSCPDLQVCGNVFSSFQIWIKLFVVGRSGKIFKKLQKSVWIKKGLFCQCNTNRINLGKSQDNTDFTEFYVLFLYL